MAEQQTTKMQAWLEGEDLGLTPAEEIVMARVAAKMTAVPTEAMCDAARPLFLYFGAALTGGFTLGQHMQAGGWSTAGLTPAQLAHAGVFPKAERAAMVWNMMEAARGKQS